MSKARAVGLLVVVFLGLSYLVWAQQPVKITDPSTGADLELALDYNVNDPADADPSGPTMLMERTDTLATVTEASGEWTNARANSRGAHWVALDSADPCVSGTKIFVPITQTTSTQWVTGTSSMRTYVCSFMVTQPSSSTQTFALVNGTGSVCASSPAAMIGGSTAANGMQLPFALGTGAGSIAKSTADAANVCLLQSGSDRIAGVMSYVVAAN